MFKTNICLKGRQELLVTCITTCCSTCAGYGFEIDLCMLLLHYSFNQICMGCWLYLYQSMADARLPQMCCLSTHSLAPIFVFVQVPCALLRASLLMLFILHMHFSFGWDVANLEE
ncbi:hypothetical protein DUNSADRAFT_10177 [Dunaliella salina]|uniref:Encoded protein n=1 Tax=Dunaliella salina TaxID=3046 RepID=A0ABQ7GG06_DUNSA|nr:hypothetical protein DUNSADRAFT_10177 [Dunaliella salina]|eukprot:KAF5833526.1 hypothetical protein DUNSADRAFT_10177 [Dunaliella salina]